MREITTPVLPSYVTACLNLVSVKSVPNGPRKLNPDVRILEPVFCSFIKLLPSHPTIFRPFTSQLHDLILPLVDTIHSPFPTPDSTIELAQKIFVSLHHCAPRNTSGEEWLKACRATILSVHYTGNHLFRAISEQWEPTDPAVRELPSPPGSSGDVGDDGADPLGLPSWTGVRDGSAKIVSMLNLLSNFVSSQTNSSVAFPLGSILDLTSRLASLLVPASNVDVSNIVNPEIGRNERESLWSELARIHVATIDLLRNVIETFGIGSLSVTQGCLDQAIYIFEAESFNRPVRTATYSLVNAALHIMGCSVSKAEITSMSPVIRTACSDLKGTAGDDILHQVQRGPNKNKSNAQNTTSNADAFLKLTQTTSADASASVAVADAAGSSAADLLRTFLSRSPVDLIPMTLRAEIDRTAIQFQQKQAMLASVLNPMPGSGKQRRNASIMPFLARSSPHSLETEGLLRPRMPVLLDNGTKNATDLNAYGAEPDVGVQDRDIAEQHEDARPLSGAPDILLSAPPPARNVVDNTAAPSEVRAKRTYEPEPAKPEAPTLENVGSASKRARTESHQPCDIQDASLSQGLTSQPFLNPSAARTEEARKTTPPPPMVPLGITSPAGPLDTIAQDQDRTTSKLNIGQDTAAQPPMAAGQSDDSDNEIPELNIEPDTDDEDEDAMGE